MNRWEVCLVADRPVTRIECREFRTLFGARFHMKRHLGRDSEFYCALITDRGETEHWTYYWNGRRIFRWDKPSVLSSRQARLID
jgi:hypothetical protein